LLGSKGLNNCPVFNSSANRCGNATANILHKLGIELIAPAQAGCCGAVSQHLSAAQEALDFMRRNIDAWWPYIEQGISGVIFLPLEFR
jgi:Fe-S oxidoreductase